MALQRPGRRADAIPPHDVRIAANLAASSGTDSAQARPGENFNDPTNHQPSGPGQLRQSELTRRSAAHTSAALVLRLS
jgi:hypothetical protein